MYQSTPIYDMAFSGDATSVSSTLDIATTMVSGNMSTFDIQESTTKESRNFNETYYTSYECKTFMLTEGGNVTHTTQVHEPIIRLIIASASFLENAIVVIALLYSWKSLRQNIYIFALSIAFSDCLLGFIHIINSIVIGLSTSDEESLQNEAVDRMGLSSWFYLIRATTLLTAQVASTGNAACLVIAFKKYVDALAPSGSTPKSPLGKSKESGKAPSGILSRKVSYRMTIFVWTVSLILGIIPLFWNCGEACACFVEAGRIQSVNASRCFENHGCSYMFPPLKSVSYILCLFLFFVTLIILVVTSVQVTQAAGGFIAFLPFRLHQYYARRRRASSEESTNLPRRLRGHSVQMNYMRDMMHFMITITFTFVICKVPSAILLFIESVTNFRLNLSNEAAAAIVILSFSHSIINPIIFTLTLHGMKEALKKPFVRCCTQTVSVSIGKQTYSSEDTHSHQQKSSAV
uniref:sphingosine 1-phosphate receptor 5-like n=1 Tax=Styela clava TaxID=7725 RepID=UPI00193AAC6F|nr:sphingosine 1-phosphate receptor 5-like [Styela clava]